MHHIFSDISYIRDEGKRLVITGEDHHHIVNVLRMRVGDEISVTLKGEEDKEYRFGIEEMGEDQIICSLRFIKLTTAELSAKCILLQGLPKADKMEQIIQKNVELGISEIIPVRMSRSVVKLDEKKAASKVERWNKIAKSAAMQSKRAVIPTVTELMDFKEALAYVSDADLKILPYELEDMSKMEDTAALIGSVSNASKAAFIIGPEGGFSEKEVETAVKEGFAACTLGGRILRTETAGMVVMSWLMYRLEIDRERK